MVISQGDVCWASLDDPIMSNLRRRAGPVR
jgi:hypothetical protein